MVIIVKPIWGVKIAGRAAGNVRYISRAFLQAHQKKFKGACLLQNESGESMSKNQVKEFYKKEMSKEKEQRFIKLEVSPDPKANFSDPELHELAKRTMDTIRSQNKNVTKFVYAIHHDTEVAHFHVMAMGQELHINKDKLAQIKIRALENEIVLKQEKTLNLEKDKSKKFVPIASQGLGAAGEWEANKAIRIFGATTSQNVHKVYVENREDYITDSIYNQNHLDILSIPTKKGERAKKDIKLRLPKTDMEGKIKSLSQADRLAKDVMEKFKYETQKDFKFEVKIRENKGFLNGTVHLSVPENSRKQFDFTKNELKELNQKFAEKYSRIAKNTWNKEYNFTEQKSLRDKYRTMAQATFGLTSLASRLMVRRLDRDIAQMDLKYNLKRSIKLDCLSIGEKQREYVLQTGSVNYQYQDILPQLNKSEKKKILDLLHKNNVEAEQLTFEGKNVHFIVKKGKDWEGISSKDLQKIKTDMVDLQKQKALNKIDAEYLKGTARIFVGTIARMDPHIATAINFGRGAMILGNTFSKTVYSVDNLSVQAQKNVKSNVNTLKHTIGENLKESQKMIKDASLNQVLEKGATVVLPEAKIIEVANNLISESKPEKQNQQQMKREMEL